MKEPVKILLGCGNHYREGWVNVDKCPLVKADLYEDFCEGLSLPDGCAEIIESNDVVEHMLDKIAMFNELGRLLQVGGIANISVPSADTPVGFQDPTHTSFWVKESFGFQYLREAPPFLGMKYSFDPLEVTEKGPDENGNKWVEAEIMKIGDNVNYDPRVKTEIQAMRDKIASLEMIVERLLGLHGLSVDKLIVEKLIEATSQC